MDISAFHADGVSSTDICVWVVADHQHIGTGETRFFKSRMEKGRSGLFYTEVGGKENPVKYSVEKAKTSKFRHGKAALCVGQQIQMSPAPAQSLQRIFYSFHQLRRAAEGQRAKQACSILHLRCGDGNALFLKQAAEDAAQFNSL